MGKSIAIKNLKSNITFRLSYVLIQFFSSFFLIPFYLENFSLEVYGIWILASSISGWLLLIDPSSNHLIVQQISKNVSKTTKINNIISASIINSLVISLFIIIIGNYFLIPLISFFLNSDELIYPFYNILQLSIINIALLVIINCLTGIFEGMLKIKKFSNYLLIFLIIKILLIIILVKNNIGIQSIIIAEICINILAIIYLIFNLFNRYIFLKTIFKLKFSNYKKFSKLFAYNYGGRLSKVFTSGGFNPFLIGKFVNIELIAVFNLTETLPKKIENISGLLSTSARSSMAYVLNKKPKKFQSKLISTTAYFSIIVSIYIYFLLYDTIQPFLKLWLSNKVILDQSFITLIVMISSMRILNFSIESILFNNNQIKFVNNIRIVQSLILIPLLFIFTFYYQLYGLLISYLICQLIVFPLLFSKIIFHFEYNRELKFFLFKIIFLILSIFTFSIFYKFIFFNINFQINDWQNLIFVLLMKSTYYLFALFLIDRNLKINLIKLFKDLD